jgi:NAD(P)-dependent dehydrogenase (short-subunit alcohol dehydrogenase family)
MDMIFSRPRYHGILLGAMAKSFLCRAAFTDKSQEANRKVGLVECRKFPVIRLVMQVVGHVDDIAQAALFLASDASRFVTGHNLVADVGISAGWPIAAARPDRELFFRTLQASPSAHSA